MERRKRMSSARVILIGSILAATVAGTRSMAAHPQPGVVSIGILPGGLNSIGAAINAKGHVAGYSDDSGNMHHAVLWDGKALRALPGLAGDVSTSALSINAHDQAAGARVDSTPAFHAVLWKKGKVTSLPELSGAFTSVATAINDAGVVVGDSESQSGIIAVMWVKGKVQPLAGVPSDVVFFPSAINKKGQVAGVGQDHTGKILPLLWFKGTLTQLPVPDPNTTAVQVRSINASGVVVGETVDSAGQHAVAWNGSQVSVLAPLAGDSGGFATAINDAGDVVGLSYHQQTSTPVIWQHGGQPVDLNTLRPSGSSLTIQLPLGINAKGQITGTGTTGSDTVGIVFTP